MIEYPKIQSVFKRDEKTHKFIEGAWSIPEFGYLAPCLWDASEKIDGTNVRVNWSPCCGVSFGGRTDKAQVPTYLLAKLQELFTLEKFEKSFASTGLTLYGEGYGAKIQKGGGNYIPDSVNFALFDVLIDGWWLKREDVQGIAEALEIQTVPMVGQMTLYDAIAVAKAGIPSAYGDFQAEGYVLKTAYQLFDRRGHRIITKMKCKDWA